MIIQEYNQYTVELKFFIFKRLSNNRFIFFTRAIVVSECIDRIKEILPDYTFVTKCKGTTKEEIFSGEDDLVTRQFIQRMGYSTKEKLVEIGEQDGYLLEDI